MYILWSSDKYVNIYIFRYIQKGSLNTFYYFKQEYIFKYSNIIIYNNLRIALIIHVIARNNCVIASTIFVHAVVLLLFWHTPRWFTFICCARIYKKISWWLCEALRMRWLLESPWKPLWNLIELLKSYQNFLVFFKYPTIFQNLWNILEFFNVLVYT